MMFQNETNSCSQLPMCKHNPCSAHSSLMRVLYFFCFCEKLYDSQYDVAKCAKCGNWIAVPERYYCSNMKIFLMWGSAAITVLLLWAMKGLLGFIVLVITIGIFYRFASAVCLAQNEWVSCYSLQEKHSKFEIEKQAFMERKASQSRFQRRTRSSAISTGCFVSVVKFSKANLTLFLPVIAVAIVVYGIVCKKTIMCYIGAGVFAYAVISLLCCFYIANPFAVQICEWLSVIIFLCIFSAMEKNNDK